MRKTILIVSLFGFFNAFAGNIVVLPKDTSQKIQLNGFETIFEDSHVRVFKRLDMFSKDERPAFPEENLYTVRTGSNLEGALATRHLLSDGRVNFQGAVNGSLILRIPQDKVEEISHILHTTGSGCGALVHIPESAPTLAERSFAPNLPRADDARTTVTALLTQVKKDNLIASVTQLGAFHTRHHNSQESKKSGAWIIEQMKTAGENVNVEEFTHKRTPQKSIIATIPGETNERVILGSHIDSIVGFGGNVDQIRSPGQDDDGSGTAALLEVLRVIAQSGQKFERTIQFMGYAAEEIGLVGSNEIAESYAKAKIPVAGVMQLDMAGYVKPGEEMKAFLITNDTNSEHTQLVADLVSTYLTIKSEKKVLDLGTSDHQSWSRRGFPAVFPTENPSAFNMALHTKGDTIDRLNFDFMENYAKLAISYIVTLAKPI